MGQLEEAWARVEKLHGKDYLMHKAVARKAFGKFVSQYFFWENDAEQAANLIHSAVDFALECQERLDPLDQLTVADIEIDHLLHRYWTGKMIIERRA